MNNALATVNVWDATVQQAAFRELAQAFSHPGKIHVLSHPALSLVPATLLDGATSFSDAGSLLSELDLARLETMLVPPSAAHFVLADGATGPDFSPVLGTLESPELGATLLLLVQSLREGKGLLLSGPGIASQREIHVRGLDPAWLAARADWNAAFPLGVDILLLAGHEVMALPRTTQIKGIESWAM